MAKQCVICCSAVKQQDFKSEVKLLEKEEQSLLLEELCKNVGGGLEGVVDSLKMEWKDESACGSCLNSLRKVVEAKRIMEETEKDVSRLQGELLAKLKMREGAVQTWKTQVSTMRRFLVGTKDPTYDKPDVSTSSQAQRPSEAKTEKEQANFQCVVCNKTFPSRGRLNRHVKIHTNERPYQCTQCKKAFQRKEYLKIHVRAVHEHEKPFSCGNCPKKFGYKSDFLKHQRTHIGMPVVPKTTTKVLFQCLFCDSKFSRNAYLERHLWRHTGEKPFSCEILNTSIENVSTVSAHLRIHQDEKDDPIRRFGCIFCEARFFKKAYLDRHMTTHTKEKPYSCGTCELSFSNSSSLRRHARSMHHNEARV